MSYDYNALVSSITSNLFQAATLSSSSSSKSSGTAAAESKNDDDGNTEQQQQEQTLALLQSAVDDLERLSAHCPLTPLLWMLYADAAGRLVTAAATAENSHENDYQQTRLDLLQLGMAEFPGSALLSVHACRVLYHVAVAQVNKTNAAATAAAAAAAGPREEKAMLLLSLLEARVAEALDQIAWTAEQDLVETLFRLQVQVLLLTLQQLLLRQDKNNGDSSEENNERINNVVERLRSSLVRRAEAPLPNHTLSQEVEDVLEQLRKKGEGTTASTAAAAAAGAAVVDEDWIRTLHHRIDQGRRLSSKVFGPFKTHHEEIDAALHREGLLVPRQQAHQYFIAHTDCLQWLLDNSSDQNDDGTAEEEQQQQQLPRNGMGLGATARTAHAYIQYALSLQRYQPSPLYDSDDDGDDAAVWQSLQARLSSPQLIATVYERGIADCPTAEAVWRSYLRHALEQLHDDTASNNSTTADTNNVCSIDLTSLLQRAVRNCPCSLTLAQERIQGPLHLANRGRILQQQQHLSLMLLDGETAASYTAPPPPTNVLAVLDPDSLVELVQETLETKFLPGQANFLALYQTVLMVVKRRILFLLSLSSSASSSSTASQQPQSYDYDEPEPIHKNNNSSATNSLNGRAVNDQDLQEALDLCEDLVDLYEDIEAQLRKRFPAWSQGRSFLWNERAQTEALLIRPLLQSSSSSGGGSTLGGGASAPASSVNTDANKSLSCEYAEKAVRTYNPPHPDTYLLYIRLFAALPTSSATDVAQRVRQVRFLFSKAVSSVGRPKKPQKDQHHNAMITSRQRDYETALSGLCHDWLEFERTFGSDRSLGRATKVAQKKLLKAGLSHPQQQRGSVAATILDESDIPEATHTTDVDDDDDVRLITEAPPQGAKRKVDHGDDEIDATERAKKPKLDESGAGQHPNEGEPKPPASTTAPQQHKVRVGKLEYPAHPFTVRVSNLNPETQDMDLVDLFKPKCGTVVHARILREKVATHPPSHHGGGGGKSKGWALVQFEERESVEKALALDDVIGLHEKILKIERSHMAAATLVPPGLHRIKEKGHGKYSKRNEKHRKGKDAGEGSSEAVAVADATPTNQQPQQRKQAGGAKTGNSGPKKDSGASVLAFRPRAVGGRGSHQKPKISLDEKPNTGK